MSVARYCVDEATPIRDAVARMDRNRAGFALVVRPGLRLVGALSDGDIRRAVLARVDFGLPVRELLRRKRGRWRRPLTAPAGASREECLRILTRHQVLFLPLVDARARVREVVTLDELMPDAPPVRAVVMAGGAGRRLRPFTKRTPKPMLRVGGRPVMEIILRRLKAAGIRQVEVATHYLRDKITRHFGNGEALGVQLGYIHEKRPLGTAGALSLMERRDGTLLVMNGDILTDVDFRALLAFHREERADLTIAVRRYDLQVPYGVVACAGSRVRRLDEKPTLDFFVSAGIYLLEPSVLARLPRGRRVDMTDLIQAALRSKRRVASFPIREYWIDIGRPGDYRAARRRARAAGAPA